MWRFIRRSLPGRAFPAVLTCLVGVSSAGATVIRVPADFDHVGDALAGAAPFDTVLVSPGTYPANIEWPPTPGLKLVGADGASVTFLDGHDEFQVIGIYTGVDTTTVVRGFTIMNGHAEGQ